jgi:hypothetical protein
MARNRLEKNRFPQTAMVRRPAWSVGLTLQGPAVDKSAVILINPVEFAVIPNIPAE